MAEQGKEGMLPKNIRQIGQISGNQKIYLEDYVITYLRQILTPDENMRVMNSVRTQGNDRGRALLVCQWGGGSAA